MVAKTCGPLRRRMSRTDVPRIPARTNDILVTCCASCLDLAFPTSDVVATVDPRKMEKAMWKIEVQTPRAAKSDVELKRPTKAVSTMESTGSASNPRTAGSAMAKFCSVQL
jgi:hypothetical protein